MCAFCSTGKTHACFFAVFCDGVDNEKANYGSFLLGTIFQNPRKNDTLYRYPTAVILIINAWELTLKAYIYKFISKKGIYEKKGKNGNQHTIAFMKALALVRDHINAR